MNDEFAAIYPDTPNAELARRYGKSDVTIKKWAAALGLKKSARYKAEVQRRNATGRVMSPESRQKVGDALRGRVQTAEEIQKRSLTRNAVKGERHWNWKGGKAWRRFRDPRYQEWRLAVLARDGYQCQSCGRLCKKREKGLAAHHVKPYAEHPELRYDVSNGVTLCRLCHMTVHGKSPRPKDPLPCACGCGTMIGPVDRYGRPRRFVNHHARRKT